jgi:hypothetical protein
LHFCLKKGLVIGVFGTAKSDSFLTQLYRNLVKFFCINSKECSRIFIITLSYQRTSIMRVFILALIASAMLSVSCQSAHTTAAAWPAQWQAHFTEKIEFPVRGTMNVEGNWWFDFTNRMFRVDRTNGNYDRYCGTVYKFANTPCSQIVREGVRHMYFPEKKFCCKCCTNAGGCGVLVPTWIQQGKPLGREDVNGTEAYKYNVAGLQNNYYYETSANKPLRIFQEPLSDMIFNSNYSESVDSKVFDLPTDGGDCNQSCGFLSICHALA